MGCYRRFSRRCSGCVYLACSHTCSWVGDCSDCSGSRYISSAGEAADAEEDRLVAKYEQMESRRERMAALEKRRDEQRFAMERQSQAMKGPGMQIPQAKGRMGPDAGHAHA